MSKNPTVNEVVISILEITENIAQKMLAEGCSQDEIIEFEESTIEALDSAVDEAAAATKKRKVLLRTIQEAIQEAKKKMFLPGEFLSAYRDLKKIQDYIHQLPDDCDRKRLLAALDECWSDLYRGKMSNGK